jgi:hypothetical protein
MIARKIGYFATGKPVTKPGFEELWVLSRSAKWEKDSVSAATLP